MEHVLLTIERKPEYLQAQALYYEKQDSLETAADIAGKLYESIVEEEGDLGDGVAPIALLYGEINLALAVASNNDLLRAQAKKLAEKKDGAASAPALVLPQEENDLPKADQEDVDEMFSIAWDSLDLARVIFHRLGQGAAKEEEHRFAALKREGEAQYRLGELKYEQGLFEDALQELEAARAILVQLPTGAANRTLSLCLQRFGMTYEAMAEESKEVAHKLLAVDYFAQALKRFKAEIGLDQTAEQVVVVRRDWKPDVLTQEQMDQIELALAEGCHPVPDEEDEEDLYDLKLLIIDTTNRLEQCIFDFTLENVLPPPAAVEEELTTTTTTTTTNGGPANVLQARKRQRTTE